MIKFAIYNILGFIMESVYVSILNRKIYFSGLLKGPFIPLYGFGALLILKTTPYYQNNFDTFFLFPSLLYCTRISNTLFLVTDSKIEIWNYSKIPHNYSNRICMFYSLMWGILGIILVNYIDPFINNIIIHLNYNLLNIIALVYVLSIIYQFYNHNYNNH